MSSPAETRGPAAEAPSPAGTGAQADLGGVAARGAAVTLVGQGARILLQLASVVVLARLLSPHDYGLMAVGLLVVGLGEVVRDLGLSTAAIRAPELSDRQRDGLFWINTAAGAALAAAGLVAAGPIAAAFGQPELESVVRVLTLTFVLNGMAAQYRAGLTRDLRFGALAGCELAAHAAGLAVAVVTAVAGAGHWALVAQQLAVGAVGLAGAVALARWVPGPFRRGSGLRPFLRFGGGITGTHLVYYVGHSLDTVALGLWAGPAALGVYNRGFQLLMTPLNQVRSPATTVAVPVLARLHDDPDRFGEYLRRGQLALGFSLVAGMAIVAGAAGPLVDLMLGDRWSAVAPVLALLAVAGSAQTLSFVGLWVYLSRGLSAALLRYTLVTVVLKAGCVLAGVPFGVVGVAAGYALSALLEWPLSLWWLARLTPLPGRQLFRGALRITACAVAAGLAAFVATELAGSWPSAGRLAVGVVAGVAAYGAAALVPSIRADLTGVLEWARRMLGRTA